MPQTAFNQTKLQPWKAEWMSNDTETDRNGRRNAVPQQGSRHGFPAGAKVILDGNTESEDPDKDGMPAERK